MDNKAQDTPAIDLDQRLWPAVEGAVQQLEERWLAGEPATISEYLPGLESPFRRRVLLELIKVDQEFRWKGVEPKLTEAYLREWPDLGTEPEVICELLEAECLTRAVLGQLPTPEELTERFPDLADQIDLQRVGQRAAQEERSAASWDLPSDFPRGGLRDDSFPASELESPPLKIGASFGRYQIVTLLGEGGKGWVYRAYDTRLRRDVALKVPRFSRSSNAELARRFLRESQAAARVEHPHVCTVHDAGEVDGICYLTMRLVRGRSLAQRLARGPLAPQEAAILASKLARALAAIHACGILHRDVKTSNVLLHETGEPLLTDFGLARPAGECNAPHASSSTSPAAFPQTAFDTDVEPNTSRFEPSAISDAGTAVQVGTIHYMPPELFADGRPDARSDVYSLGVVLYRMLTGRLPFAGSPDQIVTAIQTLPPTPPSRLAPGISPELESICLRALKKDPADRFQSANDMAEALSNLLDRPSQSPIPHRHKVTRGTLVAVGFAVLAWVLAGVIIRIYSDGRIEIINSNKAPADITVELYKGERTTPDTRVHVESNHRGDERLPSQSVESAPPTVAIARQIDTGPHVAAIEISADGRTLYASTSEMGQERPSRLLAFDVPSGQISVSTISPDKTFDHKDLAVSTDQRYAYLTNYNYFRDDIVRVDLRNPQHRDLLSISTLGRGQWGSNIAITADQRRLVVTTGGDGPANKQPNEQLSIVDIADGRLVLEHEAELPGQVGRHMLGITHTGETAYIVCVAHEDGAPVICRVSLSPPFTLDVLPASRDLQTARGDFKLCVASQFGRAFLCAPETKRIYVMDLEQDQIVDTFELGGFHPASLAVHPREALLAVECPTVKKVLLVDAIEGTIVTRVDAVAAAGNRACFSPDGRWLYVAMSPPRGGVAVIDLQPILAPPGIVFASNRAGEGYQIYRSDLAGAQIVRLTNTLGNDTSPRWSPEGRRIGFLTDRDGPCQVAVMRSDGSQLRVFQTTDPVAGNRFSGTTWDWSPTGQEIAFVSRSHSAIRCVNIQSGVVRTLLHGSAMERFDFHWSVSWSSPDRMVFSSQPTDEHLSRQMFVLNPQTGHVRPIRPETAHGCHFIAPSLSSSGRRMLAFRQPGHASLQQTLFLFDDDFRRVSEVAVPHGPLHSVTCWSADDRHLLFSAGPEDAAQIYHLDLESQSATPLIVSPGDDIQPNLFGAFP